MTTTVINLFAGPGVGKSTLAADIFSVLKKQGKSVELVREFVKDWAWEGKSIGKFDQLLILGNQVHAESILYGKVEYVVTDSPFLLSPFYEEFYNKSRVTHSSAVNFRTFARSNGVKFLDVHLTRAFNYKKEGRYETSKQALKLDAALIEFLHDNVRTFITCNPKSKNAVKGILKCL